MYFNKKNEVLILYNIPEKEKEIYSQKLLYAWLLTVKVIVDKGRPKFL